MRDAVVTDAGDRIRWVEWPGEEPSRVYVHGLGATSAAYFTAVAVHPLLAGRRSLLVDMLGHGISDRPAVVPVPDCGHNVMLDNPEAFVRATTAALAQ